MQRPFFQIRSHSQVVGIRACLGGRGVPFNPLQSCSSRMNQKEKMDSRQSVGLICVVFVLKNPSISRLDGVWWQIRCGAFGRGKGSRMVLRFPAWVAGSWFCLEHSSPKREEKAQAWHTPSFYSGLCSSVTYSERLPLSILSKMILRFSIVFYCNLVSFSQVLEIWRSSVWGWYGIPGWEGNKLFLFQLLLCFVWLPISRLSLNPSIDWLSPKILWFHLYKMSRIGKFVETESRLEAAWGWGVWSLDGKGQLMDIGFL